MRLNLSDVPRLLQHWLHMYWLWMSSGSLPRFAIGYTAPIALLVVASRLFAGGDGLAPDYASAGKTPGSTAEVAGAVASPQATKPAQASTSPTAAPTVVKSVLTYVVKSGDSLGAICSSQVPTMAFNACVAAIVELNKLSGPDQLTVGQSLSLPAAGGSTSATSQVSPGQSASPAASNTTPNATPTVRPAASSAAPAGITISSITTPIKPGLTATVKASTAPNASCALQYTAPAGSSGTPTGLVAKAADSSGSISWSWAIDGKTKKGKGLVVITCAGTSISAYIEIS